MRKAVMAGVCVFCILAALYFLFVWKDVNDDYGAGDQVYEELLDEVYPEDGPHLASDNGGDAREDANGDKKSKKDSTSAGADAGNDDYVRIPDMEKVSEVNDELVAWLYCPGTVIDYPVAHGTDNEYYLTHLATGEKNANGCLFIDCNNAGDFSDKNTVIYGHNMHSGKMFAALLGYREQSFYDSHPYMYLTCGDKTYRLEIFSAYVTDSGSDAYRMKFTDADAFADWVKEVSGRSDFAASMAIKTTDRIVTLSTCAYDFAGARYVVHGRLSEM